MSVLITSLRGQKTAQAMLYLLHFTIPVMSIRFKVRQTLFSNVGISFMPTWLNRIII